MSASAGGGPSAASDADAMSGYEYRHHPAFDHLCDVAREHGLRVMLFAGERVLFARGLGNEYRQLSRIELWEPAGVMPVWSVRINDDLEAAALNLLARAA
jgi:hypothetical protein